MTAPRRVRLEPHLLSALWQACDSTKIPALVELIDTLKPSLSDLAPGLWQAIKRGDLTLMRYLLDLGIPVGHSEIRAALEAQSIPALELIRESFWEDINANLNARGGSACTALSVCPYNPTLVAYLLRLGADPNLGAGCSGTYGHPLGRQLIPDSGSTLRGAVRQGSLECLTLLIQAGGNWANAKLVHPAIESRDVTAIAHVLRLGADVDEADDLFKTGYPVYRTPLLRAIKLGATDAVAFLLANGANVMKAGYDGFTPLDIVKMECCGGRSPCRVGMHGRDILPEIRELIEKAVERARSLGVSTDGKQAPILEGHDTAE